MDEETRRVVRAALERAHRELAVDARSPLDDVTVALDLELCAHDALTMRVRAARAAGHDWDHIAFHARGFEQVWGADAGRRLFEYVASPPSDPGLYWCCEECRGVVVDRGPGMHPTDAEPGHRDDCARHQRDIAAHQARLEADDMIPPPLLGNRRPPSGTDLGLA